MAMANPEHLAILKQGVEAWNQWRKAHPDTQPDLLLEEFGAIDLRGFDFSGANLSSSSFRNADLRRADFCHANLSNADLSESDLRGADLGVADLCETNLERTNLTDADFQFANLSWTRLCGADLTRAHLGRTVLASVDLRDAHGLSGCIHIGPSSIDHLTIIKSWPLPVTFLRGCGLPETLIEYFTTFLNRPVQLCTCFISYSTNDQPFADRLYSDLQNRGVRCWFAPHDLKGGRKLHEQIDEAIRIYDRLLLILSDSSMSSEWVKTEIATARQRETREKRQMLFPISLVPFEQIRDWKAFDADIGKDSAREIREYFIPDFSNWKDHDSYQKAFDRLLRDLKAEQRSQGDGT